MKERRQAWERARIGMRCRTAPAPFSPAEVMSQPTRLASIRRKSASQTLVPGLRSRDGYVERARGNVVEATLRLLLPHSVTGSTQQLDALLSFYEMSELTTLLPVATAVIGVASLAIKWLLDRARQIEIDHIQQERTRLDLQRTQLEKCIDTIAAYSAAMRQLCRSLFRCTRQ